MIGPTVIISAAGLILSIATSVGCSYLCSKNEKHTPDKLRDVVKDDLRSKLENLRQKQRALVVLQGKKKLQPLIDKAEKFCNKTSSSYITDLENRLNARCTCNLMRNVCVENQARASLEVKFSKLNRLIGEVERMLEEPVKGYKQKQVEENIVGQERRNEIWDKVSSADENGAGTICIHGPMGVGKTAIAISIHNQALKEEHDGIFDYVIWVTLKYGDDHHQVQEKIADKLGIVLSACSSAGRAQSIHDNLLQKDKFLLVLDSMWQPLSLRDIGVPKLGKSRKLIVTSRIRNICNKITGECFFFEVQPLPLPTQRKLFNNITKFPTIQPKLTHDNDSRTLDALAGLDGIPLAINNLAETLMSIRDDADNEFNAAWKKELDLAEKSKDQELMRQLTPSYDNLEQATSKRCFLYCALLPKDLLIQSKELIEYWMLEGLLDVRVENLQKLMEHGTEILYQLKNRHLLHKQGSGDDEKFKMLSLVRSMGAYKLATQEVNFPTGVSIFRPRAGLTRLTPALYDDLKSDQVKGVSTLLLQDIRLSSNSDHDADFFNNMPGLRVVDLSRTDISTLPSSLSNSTNLQALLLRRCQKLKRLPNLSKLQQLIVLDLSDTPVEHFPEGIEDMRRLRRLDLSQTRIDTFRAGVVDKLTELEELLLITKGDSGGIVWRTRDLETQQEEACVEDLKDLQNLTILQLTFVDAEAFKLYIDDAKERNKVPPKFDFCVGRGPHSDIVLGAGENIISVFGDHSIELPNKTSQLHMKKCIAETISELMVKIRRLSNLQVLGVYYITDLVYLFPVEILESLKKLRELRVENCESMVDIVDPAAPNAAAAAIISLPGLTKMVFADLPKLNSKKGISCPLLASVEVWNCPSTLNLPIIYDGSQGSENPRPRNNIEIKGDISDWIHNFKNGSGDSHPVNHFQPYPTDHFILKLVSPYSRPGYWNKQQESDTNSPIDYTKKYNWTEKQLKKKGVELENLIVGQKDKQEMGVVLPSKLSSLIRRAEAFAMEPDGRVTKVQADEISNRKGVSKKKKVNDALTRMENKLKRLSKCISDLQTLSQEPVKGCRKSPEVVIVGKMRTQAKEEIWEAVSDQAEGAGTTFIHGTLGVGKTATAISIHNQALKGELFDHVIWVAVEYWANLHKVQEGIAQSMEIVLPTITTNNPCDRKGEKAINADGDDIIVERARTLRNALLKRGKFLLVLDSVWQPLSPDDVGIPPLVNGRKLIVTSRIRNVCDEIIDKKTFEIKPLHVEDKDQAWEILIGSSKLDLKTEPTTVVGTKEALLEGLDGLPLAITTFAQRLGNRSSAADLDQAWREELDKLASDPNLFEQWKNTYKSLNPATRRCVLYCALFPKDYPIKSKHLIEYWRLEGLLGDDTDTLAKGNKDGIEALNQLVNAHVLQPVTGEDVNLLGNFIRSMAIVTRDKEKHPRNVFIRPRSSLSIPPSEDAAVPNFSTLSTLLLQGNDSLAKTYENEKYFSNMSELKVLDMSRTNISSLSKSVLELKKLRALLLRNCPKLAQLPDLSNLQEVIVLDLSGTPLEDCPQGIQKMIKLRRLDLSQTKLATFPVKVVRELEELEELLMITAMDCVWGSSEDKQWNGPCVEEFGKLKKLATLHLHFRNKLAFDNYVKTAKVPQTFRFQVGDLQSGKNDKENNSRAMPISDSTSSIAPENSPLQEFHLLNLLNLNCLDVFNLSDSHLFSAEILKFLTQLTELRVRSCKAMVDVLEQQEPAEIICLPHLNKLLLFDLPRLKRVCHGQVLNCPTLCSVQIWRCDNLEFPVIHSQSNEIQIIGERTWIDDVNPSIRSNPKFIFSEGVVAANVDAAATTTNADRVAQESAAVTIADRIAEESVQVESATAADRVAEESVQAELPRAATPDRKNPQGESDKTTVGTHPWTWLSYSGVAGILQGISEKVGKFQPAARSSRRSSKIKRART